MLDTGIRTAAENMALDEVLVDAKSKGLIPNTIRFLRFSPPAVLVGYHQSVEQEVRVDFCSKEGIDINRRITGGGAIYFDETQLGWEIICEKSFFKTKVADERFFEELCQPIIFALKKIGIEAAFRPRNDIEVNGRKISGTGGTEKDNAFLFQGTLLVDFDVSTMLRALRIPIEKLKDKEIESVKERVTCIADELGYVPCLTNIKRVLKEGFEHVFGIKLVESNLTNAEKRIFEEKLKLFKSEEWIYKVRAPTSEQNCVYSSYKTKGGLIRVSLILNDKLDYINSVLLTGDFFVYPRRSIYDLEAALKNMRANRKAVADKIFEFFSHNVVEITDVGAQDFVNAICEALEKVELSQFGIPISLANQIWLIKGSFYQIKRQGISMLLLPYCAKPTECEFRHRKDCIQCGECNIGEAYRMAMERELGVTTILDFEDLMATLKDCNLPYIGCCCEPFYVKHRKEIEKVGPPGILLGINNATCYDLGKEREAYIGRFENKTEIDIDLLKKVLDAKV